MPLKNTKKREFLQSSGVTKDVEANIDRALERCFKSIFEEPGFIALFLPLLAATSAIFLLSVGNLYPESFTSYQASSFHGLKTAVHDFIMENIWRIAFSAGAYMSASIVLGFSAVAGTILKASAMERGEYISFVDALKRGLGFVPRLFVASILMGSIVAVPFLVFLLLGIFVAPVLLIGMVLWIIPAIYLGARLLLYAQACVTEDLGPIECLKDAWNTSEDNFWSIFVIAFALMMILGVASMLPSTILLGKVRFLGSMIALAITAPIYNIALTILYLVLSKS